jgi:hypothetical protein
MAKFISLYVKKQLRLDRLTFPQLEMQRIGQFALDQVKQRLFSATALQDQPAKPLSKGYAIWKMRMISGNAETRQAAGERAVGRMGEGGLGRKLLKAKNPRRASARKLRTLLTQANQRIHSNKRDYCVTGEFLDNLTLRSVNDNQAIARWTKDDLRNRALALSNKDEFFGYSPNDRKAIYNFTRPVFLAMSKRLVIQKELSAPL